MLGGKEREPGPTHTHLLDGVHKIVSPAELALPQEPLLPVRAAVRRQPRRHACGGERGAARAADRISRRRGERELDERAAAHHGTVRVSEAACVHHLTVLG